MIPDQPPSAAPSFSSLLQQASEIYTSHAGDWSDANELVLAAADVAVEEKWRAAEIWQAYHGAGAPVSPERLISALAKKRLELTGPLNARESPEHILSILEDAERVDMLTLGETAFAPELPASH